MAGQKAGLVFLSLSRCEIDAGSIHLGGWNMDSKLETALFFVIAAAPVTWFALKLFGFI